MSKRNRPTKRFSVDRPPRLGRRLLRTTATFSAAACLLLLNDQNAAASWRAVAGAEGSGKPCVGEPGIRHTRRAEAVFIDAGISDRRGLLSSIDPTTPVYLLEPGRNPLEQIVEHLAGQGPVEAIHLISHGGPGELYLGSRAINTDNLAQYRRELRSLAGCLTGARDLFIYGCDLGAGQEGHRFIAELSRLMNADIAASDDPTGAAALGGDWDLEIVAGRLDEAPLSAPGFSGLLAPSGGTFMTGDGSGGGGGGLAAGGAGGGNDDTLTGTALDDVIIGDGSGGGGGGGGKYAPTEGGLGGGGNDTLFGGAGNDILIGDGFHGGGGSGGVAGAGGFGGGGGGGGRSQDSAPGGTGGIGGGGGGGGGDYATGATPGGSGGVAGGGGGGGSAKYAASAGGSGGGFGAADGIAGTAADYFSGTPGSGGGGGGYNASGGAGSGQGGSGGRGGGVATKANRGGDASGLGDGGGGGGLAVSGGTGGNGGAGGTAGSVDPVTIPDPDLIIYNQVQANLAALPSLGGGGGNDLLDGGSGSDHLFGKGGQNVFIFESDDATSGSDVDTIWDFTAGTGNQIRLQSGGAILSWTEVMTIIAAQSTSGNDRSIRFSDGTNQVTVLVKNLGRDLVLGDFDYTGGETLTKILMGDGSGGGGGGGETVGGNGGGGGGDDDTVTGTASADIIFGDGSGGGGGGAKYGDYQGAGGSGGGGADLLHGGGGDDILFGDGFNGSAGNTGGGAGGFGGGGGGGGKSFSSGGAGGLIGGGGGGGGRDGGIGGGGGVGAGSGGNGGSGKYASGGTGGAGASSGGSGGSGNDEGGGGGGGFGGGNGGGPGGDGAAGPTTPTTMYDTTGTDLIANTIKASLATLASAPGGNGSDTLDGGPGSDLLFGMGGANTFVFDSDDATSGSDTDTIWGWNSGSGNKIRLQTGGTTLSFGEVTTVFATQSANGNDRSLVFTVGANQVTITVKNLGRDLTYGDFEFTGSASLPKIIIGDGSGGGGGGNYGGFGGNGGAGGGDDDTLTGTDYNDILFGDGSGGGGGGGDDGKYVHGGTGGTGGSGADALAGGSGNDILFGDGFNGANGTNYGGAGGIGGGGGGGGQNFTAGGAGGTIGGGGGGGGKYGGGGSGGFQASSGNSGGGKYGGGGSGGTGAGPGASGGSGYSVSGGGGGGFGGGNGGTGGGTGGAAGSTSPSEITDVSGTDLIYNTVKAQLATLTTAGGGNGNDTLDGGPGSDDLFGMGGANTFVFESDDATSGSDLDTIWDWSRGTGNTIRLTTTGSTLSSAAIHAILKGQTANGSDRSIVHAAGANKVTITVKNLGRDLSLTDLGSTNTPPAFSGSPAITGTPLVGSTLGLADTGTGDVDGDTVVLRYQWQSGGSNIGGATSATYTLTASELGTMVTCEITADDGLGLVNSTTMVETAGVTVVGDQDSDGVADTLDNCPTVSNSSQSDANSNGIGDACDTASDTDRDGLSDADEITAGTDPTDSDSDGDGFFDGQEVLAGSNPLDNLDEPVPGHTVFSDFNGDGRRDILWHRDTDGGNLVWLTGQDGTSVTLSSWMGNQGTNWRLLGSGDFDGDGNSDLLYRDDTTGQQLVYQTSQNGRKNESRAWLGPQLPATSGWTFAGIADFNGDGRADILWRRTGDGANQVWFTGPGGTTVAETLRLGGMDTAWTFLGTGDFNGDGNADLFYRNPTTGQPAVALTNSSNYATPTKRWLSHQMLDGSGWRFAGIGDFNGDGRDDILWHANGDGSNLVWYLGAGGTTVENTQYLGQLGTWWSLKGTGDFDGDGNADLLYRAEGNGQQLVYLTSGDGLSMATKVYLGHQMTTASGWKLIDK